MANIRLVLRLIGHRIYSMFMGYGFGSCPRCGWLFCYRFAKGTYWTDIRMGHGLLTCCPGESIRGLMIRADEPCPECGSPTLALTDDLCRCMNQNCDWRFGMVRKRAFNG